MKKIKVASMRDGGPANATSVSCDQYDYGADLVSGLPLGSLLEYGDGTDLDLSIHRRKLLRRAANRKSAQLSRARKKTHMQDLQAENARLQRIADINDSQPDLVFCTAGDGRITYLSERMQHATRDMLGGSGSEGSKTGPVLVSHVNQLLVPESVQLYFEAINQLNHEDHDEHSISTVKLVHFLDAGGFSLSGGLRCSRLVRTPLPEKEDDGSGAPSSSKRARKNDDDGSDKMYLSTDMLVDAAAVLSALPMASTSTHDLEGQANANTKTDKETSSSHGSNGASSSEAAAEEEEYVCVLRHYESSALQGASGFSCLSTASMVEHDRSSASRQFPEERRGSPSTGSTGSSSAFPVSSNDTNKNSTSSDSGAGSEGNSD